VKKFLLRILLKLSWTVGGKSDAQDGIPRVLGPDIEPHLARMHPGDVVLVGNNGGLSHIALHVGSGQIVHSMATEKTMRGMIGSLIDAIKRMFGWSDDSALTGVLEEPLAGFFDRYERDTWLILRHEQLLPEQAARGVAHARTLIGKAYDYDFEADDDEYYCTEIVLEFLSAALGDTAPQFAKKKTRVPMLLDTEVVEPIAVLHSGALTPVLGNAAARISYEGWLGDAHIVGE